MPEIASPCIAENIDRWTMAPNAGDWEDGLTTIHEYNVEKWEEEDRRSSFFGEKAIAWVPGSPLNLLLD